MDVTEEKTCTLRAEAHHPPVVMESAGFCTEHSAKSRSIGYEKEMSPTLRAGVVPAAVCFENHSQDTRYKELGDIAPTVSATYGMGGNNQPFVVEKTYDVRLTSEGTKNARQNVYETDTARTVDTGGIPPDANQGGIAVVEAYGICSKDSNAMKSKNPDFTRLKRAERLIQVASRLIKIRAALPLLLWRATEQDRSITETAIPKKVWDTHSTLPNSTELLTVSTVQPTIWDRTHSTLFPFRKKSSRQ